MAWTTPMTFSDGNALTAAQLNTYLRDNLMETMTAKATPQPPLQPGGMFIVDAANHIVERRAAFARLDTQGVTSSGTLTDLADVGPSVTLETGSSAFVMANARVWNDNGEQSVFSYGVTGDTTITASDDWAFVMDGVQTAAGTITNTWHGGLFDFQTGLNPGTNTFTMKYRSGGAGIARFRWRFIAVLPM